MKTLTLLTTILFTSVLAAEMPPKVDFGFFLDTYYAYDLNDPAGGGRTYTTLPTRHNELALNLAFVEGKLNTDRVHARLALQAGTGVDANYSAEPRPLVSLLQEAYAGYRAADGLWIDAGIFFSHIGMESFISRDNWTYTRSLVADFSPYYQAGIRLTYDINSVWSAQLHLLNGWQNIVETNSDKAVGTQIVFKPTSRFSVTHNGFIGRESEFRIFQDLIVKYAWTEKLESGLTFDFGLQKRPGQSTYANWYGASLIARAHVRDTSHVALRAEYYSDPEGIIVPTGTPQNFRTFGASVNWDEQLTSYLLWRTEVRYLRAQDEIFSGKRGTLFGVTSFALSL